MGWIWEMYALDNKQACVRHRKATEKGGKRHSYSFLGTFNLNYEAYSNVHEVTLANLEGKNYI